MSVFLTMKCNHGLRRHTIVQSILADVFHGRLSPGQHLVTQELAARFGVSHTPIREALISLAGIGIITLLPNRGAVVKRVTKKDVREVCQVRKALECQAVRNACGRISPETLRDLAQAIRDMVDAPPPEPTEYVAAARALDTRLHDLIAESSGNAFLTTELARLMILFRGFRDISYFRHKQRNDLSRLEEEAKEHLAILDALLAQDRIAAARAMARHIRSGVKYWSRSLPS